MDWSAESRPVDEWNGRHDAVLGKRWERGQSIISNPQHLNRQSTYLINEYNQKLAVKDPWEGGLLDE